MEIEYIAKILPDGHLSIDPAIAKHFKRGERIKVCLSKITEGKPLGPLSDQAEQLLNLFEKAPSRGGFAGCEITREFIHEQ